MTEARFVYVTAASETEAREIAGSVIAERLAACANLLPGMRSIYRWQDEVAEAAECVLILKTRSGQIERLIARVKNLHSYDCPCIVVLPIEKGYPPFLSWLVSETTVEGVA